MGGKKRKGAGATGDGDDDAETSRAFATMPSHVQMATQKYLRASDAQTKGIKDRKLRAHIKTSNKRGKEAALQAARSEILLTESAGDLEAEGIERTYKFKQREIRDNVDSRTQKKMFSLDLSEFGPYRAKYTRNGKHMLIAGSKGHLAAIDWRKGTIVTELNVRETVRDACWLHNETMFAVAQKKYTFIYDSNGTELHCWRKHIDPQRLVFLPYHFLLCSIGNAGYLKYQDVSTGQLVAEQRTKLGSCQVITQNPQNAVVHLGHANGTVTMWSPTVSTPLVKMMCHRGPVSAAAVTGDGQHMITAGLDGQMKVWDVRKYKESLAYFTRSPAHSISVSQRGHVAVGYGPHVEVWKDLCTTKQSSPYMTELLESKTVTNVEFCPFEDMMVVGHSRGIMSAVVPGSGEANFDALEANPYETKKQRQETEVKALLEKIQPEMISLDKGSLTRVDRSQKEKISDYKKAAFTAANVDKTYKPKFKMRGKSSSSRRYLRKGVNIVDANRAALRAKLEDARQMRLKKANPDEYARQQEAKTDGMSKSLNRFRQTFE